MKFICISFICGSYVTDITYLNNNSIFQSELRINLAYLSMAITKIQLLNFLVYLFLADCRSRFSIGIQSPMHEGRMLIVEPGCKIVQNVQNNFEFFEFLLLIKE